MTTSNDRCPAPQTQVTRLDRRRRLSHSESAGDGGQRGRGSQVARFDVAREVFRSHDVVERRRRPEGDDGVRCGESAEWPRSGRYQEVSGRRWWPEVAPSGSVGHAQTYFSLASTAELFGRCR